jgi:hypothetical protein
MLPNWEPDMHQYKREEWRKFRKEVIELDGGVCTSCKRGPLEGAVLQIHHKSYIQGKLPWEYPYELCETLCKGCHAAEHGIVSPFIGWRCVGHEDLGDLSGNCELCGNEIRHVFLIEHDLWPHMEVGEVCCDHLTETKQASDHIEGIRRFKSRQARFVNSRRWQSAGNSAEIIHQKGRQIIVQRKGEEFTLVIDGTKGKKRFPTSTVAKRYVFEVLENGKIDQYFSKSRRSR